jgi:hypothetical protein
MNLKDLELASISLRKGEIFRMPEAAGQRIEVLSGCLWITQDGDPKDSFATPGAGFTVERDGDTLASALSDSTFVMLVAA